jgi:hypothetical protein
MTLFKKHFAALAVASLFVFAAHARADEWNKRTVITIDEPMQLPNTTLQPGTYVFKLLSNNADRHIVQIFDKSETHVLATILAIPNYRLTPTGKSVFAFWETPAGTPKALRAWFYPGDNFGQEFAYPKNTSAELAAANKAPVPTTSAETAEDMKTAPVAATTETGEQNTLDASTYTAPAAAPTPEPAPEPVPQVAQAEPAPTPAPEPEPQATPAPAELPHTASAMPLVGLAGLLMIGAFFALGRFERVQSRKL